MLSRLLRRFAVFILGLFADDFGHAVILGTGGSSVLTVAVLAIWSDFRELSWQWHVVFSCGWLLIIYVAAWIAWPTILKWRASTRAEDAAVAEAVKWRLK